MVFSMDVTRMLFKEIFKNVEVEANSIYAQLKAGTKSYIT